MKFQEILVNLLGIVLMLLIAIMVALAASLAISAMYRSGKHEAETVTTETTAPEGTLMRCVPVEKKHATKD